ncbi:hypothetical protein [Ensifer sp. SL37]|uniref:hypothetical protein n=1 Tax=Ensifer sp. SL37 TaxID=2995137 RepID=UPI002273A236|nr:hypothetical protein [Ensifer sp. SL37]MCY1740487.1 hypothetical protein [Ensifer sp. SL37]
MSTIGRVDAPLSLSRAATPEAGEVASEQAAPKLHAVSRVDRRKKPSARSDDAAGFLGSGAVDGAAALGPEIGVPAAVKTRHEELMLLAGEMGSAQAATHIGFGLFLSLASILSQPNWVRAMGCYDQLMRLQIVSVKEMVQ